MNMNILTAIRSFAIQHRHDNTAAFLEPQNVRTLFATRTVCDEDAFSLEELHGEFSAILHDSLCHNVRLNMQARAYFCTIDGGAQLTLVPFCKDIPVIYLVALYDL